MDIRRRQIRRIRKVKDFFVNGRIFHPYRLKIRSFSPGLHLSVEKGHYLIKTAENGRELASALKLRYRVFHHELLEHRKGRFSVDIDRFDFLCDHLIVMDRKTDRYIGTYRLNSSNNFYSAMEFDIENILKLHGAKLELGRACVDKEYRSGAVIALLWRGIAEYIRVTGARYIFGCSSIMTTDFIDACIVYKYLKENHYSAENQRVWPRKKFRIKGIERYDDFIPPGRYSVAAARKLLPSLLDFYLKAGAVICGEPALDKNFHCIDFLTLLDMKQIKKSIEKKYQV
jgi:putative hemolysin